MIYYIHGEVVNVVVSGDMPIGMPEHVWKNPDGSYTVKLNAMYDDDTMRYALDHAFRHILRDDFAKTDTDVDLIEYEAHYL